jgi:hypothetical protein
MRSSTFLAVAAALVAPTFALESTVVPIQQIGDGQIQNPATPLPPASSSAISVTTSSYAVPPVVTSVYSSAVVTSVVASPPVVKPTGGGIPPAYGNVTSTRTGVNTVTQSVIKPSKPASSASGTTAGVASPSASKPSVQTGAANTLVGSTIGLGAAALLAAFLG